MPKYDRQSAPVSIRKDGRSATGRASGFVPLQAGLPLLVSDLIDAKFFELKDRLRRSQAAGRLIQERDGLKNGDPTQSHKSENHVLERSAMGSLHEKERMVYLIRRKVGTIPLADYCATRSTLRQLFALPVFGLKEASSESRKSPAELAQTCW